jgi:ribonuclease T1
MLHSSIWRIGVGLLLCLPIAVQAHGHHQGHHQGSAATGQVSAGELPFEARATLRLIKQGGPFPYARDGVVFSNYEHRLPQQARGYYHEYTVKTPGAANRGTRRIVCGVPPECYYSDDHYRTFRRIKE